VDNVEEHTKEKKNKDEAKKDFLGKVK